MSFCVIYFQFVAHIPHQRTEC